MRPRKSNSTGYLRRGICAAFLALLLSLQGAAFLSAGVAAGSTGAPPRMEFYSGGSHVYDGSSAATTRLAKRHIDARGGEGGPARGLRRSTSSNPCGLATKGAEILPKPVVDNPKLGNIVNDLYKGTTNPNRVGTGTTADAIRNEIATGQATAGRFHAQKGLEYERGLGNFLRRNPSASYRDRLTAQSLLDDLRSARGGP